MCDQIVKFCSGSTKPLLFFGCLLTLLGAAAIGYTGWSQHNLFEDIDAKVAQKHSLLFYLQLGTAVYLTLVTLLTIIAAHYGQKHSIRALAIITAVNFVLAGAAVSLVPNDKQLDDMFNNRLVEAAKLYDFTEKPQKDKPAESANNTTLSRATRQADGSGPAELTPIKATEIWDKLQARGCCGINNATLEWREKIPKSCCAESKEEGGKFTCKEIDTKHKDSCLELIRFSSLKLLLVLASIALVNLYLATVSGINAYRIFHYNEASQGAY